MKKRSNSEEKVIFEINGNKLVEINGDTEIVFSERAQEEGLTIEEVNALMHADIDYLYKDEEEW